MPQSTQHEQTNKFSFELLYRANLRPPPRREVLTPALPFYERHPEWKPPADPATTTTPSNSRRLN